MSEKNDRSIGEVATVTGLSVHALRFLERRDVLLRQPPRSSSGRRVYAEADVEWLLLCNRLRESGMPIAEIARFAGLVRSGPGNEADRLALLQAHERTVRASVADLKANLAVISDKVSTYQAHVDAGTTDGVWDPMAHG